MKDVVCFEEEEDDDNDDVSKSRIDRMIKYLLIFVCRRFLVRIDLRFLKVEIG